MTESPVKLIYFSPTRTTRTILTTIAGGIGANTPEEIDLTWTGKVSERHFGATDALVIFGVPVYGGRVPLTAVERLKVFTADRTPAALVVVYGNRAFEDALLELRDITESAGFTPVAGAAFIGEHSFATAEKPIALNRPDAEDLRKAAAFGKKIGGVMNARDPVADYPALDVPGNRPFRERKAAPLGSPESNAETCILCGRCAESCPTGAVNVDETVTTETAGCIRCCACIKNCPTGARFTRDAHVLKITDWLYDKFMERREPEVFFP